MYTTIIYNRTALPSKRSNAKVRGTDVGWSVRGERWCLTSRSETRRLGRSSSQPMFSNKLERFCWRPFQHWPALIENKVLRRPKCSEVLSHDFSACLLAAAMAGLPAVLMPLMQQQPPPLKRDTVCQAWRRPAVGNVCAGVLIARYPTQHDSRRGYEGAVAGATVLTQLTLTACCNPSSRKQQ